MKKLEILKHNSPKFISDFERVRTVMVKPYNTNHYFEIKKKDLLSIAEITTISYRITDKVFLVKRNVMVIE